LGADEYSFWGQISGLDIYQKPESRYGLSEVDQAKKKCRETEIIFLRNEEIENYVAQYLLH
jgi:hypothetical protein